MRRVVDENVTRFLAGHAVVIYSDTKLGMHPEYLVVSVANAYYATRRGDAYGGRFSAKTHPAGMAPVGAGIARCATRLYPDAHLPCDCPRDDACCRRHRVRVA